MEMPVLRAVEDGNRTMRTADDVAGFRKWLMSTGAAMPSYNIRHSIATKVAAKKTGKGYTLSAEYCDLCEMPMMTLKGKTDCKVCPAIKKWMQRRDGGIITTEQGGVDEARDVIDSAEVDTEIRDAEESRDEMPVDPPVCDSTVVCDSQVDIVADETPLTNNHIDITAMESTESTDSDNSTSIRERARQIIMNAKNRLGVALAAIDDDNDHNELSKDESSVESKSDQSEVVLSESMEDQMVRDRAAKIIMQARKKLQAERGYCAEEVKLKEPEVIYIEQNKSVEDKSAMTSELMDVITIPINEVLPPNEVVPDEEEVIPEVKMQTIDTTESLKPSDKYEVVEVVTVTSSKSDVTLETLKAALKEEIKVIESHPMKIEEVNEVQKEEHTDNAQVKIDVGEVEDRENVVQDASQDKPDNAEQVIIEGVVQAVVNLVDKSPDNGVSLVDDIVTEEEPAAVDEEQLEMKPEEEQTEEEPAAADEEQLEIKPEEEQTADCAEIPSSASIGTQEHCMTMTKYGGIFSGIANNIINAASDVATTFQSLVICNVDSNRGPFDDDCVYVPPQYEARTKYNPHEAATYEVADTYHLSLLSPRKSEYQAVVLEEHLIDTIIASAKPPVAPQSLASTVLHDQPHIQPAMESTTICDSGVLSVGTMQSPQNIIVKETINAYNPSNVYSKPPLPRPVPVEPQGTHMHTLPSVSADSWGDSHPTKQFELSMKLRVDEEIELWKQQESAKQLQVNEEIELSKKLVNEAKIFLVGNKETIDAPVDANSIKPVEDAKVNMAIEVNKLPPMDDAMFRVEDAKMSLNHPGMLMQMDDAMRRVEEAKMFVNSRRTPTAQYHGSLPIPMRVPLKMNPIGDNHPGCFSRQTSTVEVNNPQMAPSLPPQVFRGKGSLIDNAPQAMASAEPWGSGYNTPQMPGKYFFA